MSGSIWIQLFPPTPWLRCQQLPPVHLIFRFLQALCLQLILVSSSPLSKAPCWIQHTFGLQLLSVPTSPLSEAPFGSCKSFACSFFWSLQALSLQLHRAPTSSLSKVSFWFPQVHCQKLHFGLPLQALCLQLLLVFSSPWPTASPSSHKLFI